MIFAGCKVDVKDQAPRRRDHRPAPARPSGSGILVQRVQGQAPQDGRARAARHAPQGHLRLRWNLRVNGKPLHPGRYRVTLRALDKQQERARPHPAGHDPSALGTRDDWGADRRSAPPPSPVELHRQIRTWGSPPAVDRYGTSRTVRWNLRRATRTAAGPMRPVRVSSGAGPPTPSGRRRALYRTRPRRRRSVQGLPYDRVSREIHKGPSRPPKKIRRLTIRLRGKSSGSSEVSRGLGVFRCAPTSPALRSSSSPWGVSQARAKRNSRGHRGPPPQSHHCTATTYRAVWLRPLGTSTRSGRPTLLDSSCAQLEANRATPGADRLEQVGLVELRHRQVERQVQVRPEPLAPPLDLRERVAQQRRPSGTIRPVSSQIGRNAVGSTMPRSGCCERTSASKARTSPLWVSTIGWK